MSTSQHEALNRIEQVQRYVSEELLNGRMAVAEDDDLLGNGMVDSMGMMWLISFIEQELGIPVPPEDVTIEHFRSVRTIGTYLDARASE